jgi:hypothetical protein
VCVRDLLGSRTVHIEALYKYEITREIGALSVGTMRRVDSGLAAALSLTLQ